MEELRDQLHGQLKQRNEELRTFLAPFQAEKRQMTAEDQQEWDRRNAEMDDLEQRIDTLNKRIGTEKRIDEYQHDREQLFAAGGHEDRELSSNEELEKRFLDWARGKGPGNTPAETGRSAFEIPLKGLEVRRNEATGRNEVIESRSESRTGLLSTPSSAGGATIPQSFRAILYQHLVFNAAVRQTRATVLTTDSGEALLLPKTTAHPADGTIVGEGAVINENDPTFGQGTLNAYKFANLVQVSSELLTDTGVDLLGYLAKAMGRSLGLGAGHKYVTGTGTSEPQGVLTGIGAASGTVVAGGTGTAGVPTYKELESVYDAIIPPYQVNGEWLMSQNAVSKLRGLTDTLGRPLWLAGITGPMPNEIFGHPYYLDPYMPNAGTSATSIVFGDFSPFFIRDVNGLRFERSVDFAFNTDLVTFRAIIRTDSRLLDLTAPLAAYKGGTA